MRLNNVTEIAPNTLTPMHVITAMYLIGLGDSLPFAPMVSIHGDGGLRNPVVLKRAIVSPRDASSILTKESCSLLPRARATALLPCEGSKVQ